MNEQSIFSEALDIDDANLRVAFLDQACGNDAALRKRLDSLLKELERSGDFLSVPALEQIKAAGLETNFMHDDATTKDDQQQAEQLEFGFLQPSSVPGSLGSLGHYDIQELIGEGGFGIVFKAFDQRLHRVVAIKVLKPEMAVTSPAKKRFLREARATAAIRHQNIVHIYAVEDTPIPFLVMEFIDGKTLQQLIDETGPLDLQTILRIGQRVADGLEAAHQKGLIHRDIKPANILIESGTDQIKVVDFGLVRVADDASESQSMVIAGTALYMSPEQAQGYKLDCRSDLFSLGSVLYVMCSGRPPFRAKSPLAVLKRVVDEEPRHIQEIIPEIPDWLVAIVSKLHAKDPAERYVSAQEVADLLAAPPMQIVQRLNPLADRPSSVSRVSRPVRQWMTVAAIILLLLSSLGVTEATGITNFRGTVIRLFSPQGTLVVEVDDPEVSLSIDGEQLVITGAGVKELRVKPGEHRVTASKDGKVLLQELVTVSRDGRQVVRVSREDQPMAALPDTDRRAAEYVLSIGGKVRIDDDHPSPYGTNPEIKSLDDLPDHPFQLTHVALDQNDRVVDAGLASLRGTKNLRAIYIDYSTNFSNDALAYLSENRNLQVITCYGTNITGAGLAHFKDCPNLRDIRFGLTPMTAKDLSVLQSFQNLDKLGCLMLSSTGANDSTLALLSAAPRLNQLNLDLTDITDAGLVHLEQHHELHFLDISKTRVTRDGYQRLSRALPKCNILWKESEVVLSNTSQSALWSPTADEQAFFDQVAKLPPSEQAGAVGQKLAEINPGFDGKVTHKIENDRVVTLSFQGDAIENIWPVRALPNITKLQCVGTHLTFGKLSDLSSLAGLPLTTLDISNSSVSDLSPLKGMPLKNLYCAHTKISDLSPVSGLPLRALFLWSCPHISDLSPLSGMPLEFLGCDYTNVADISPLRGVPLSRLHVHSTRVFDLSPLRGIPLVELHCSNTQVTDLSPLEGAPLKQLHIENTRVTDLSPILAMPLETLRISETLAGRNVELLRVISTLKTINDQPVADSVLTK